VSCRREKGGRPAGVEGRPQLRPRASDETKRGLLLPVAEWYYEELVKTAVLEK